LSSVEDGNEIMAIGVAGPFFSGFGEDLLVMIWREMFMDDFGSIVAFVGFSRMVRVE
jgi:hypothetical protein